MLVVCSRRGHNERVVMSEHQKDTEFLTHLISYDDTDERRILAERIAGLQRDERCVRRAIWLMALFAALSVAGICYAAVFLFHPMNLAQFMMQFTIKVLCAVGLGSLICVLAFHAMCVSYRKELAGTRDECRRLAIKIMEERLVAQLRNTNVRPRAISPEQPLGEGLAVAASA
jgi:formate hydrogenlyase subunit 3/multisubunit Na+/H+ antiporter MnhD subunit